MRRFQLFSMFTPGMIQFYGLKPPPTSTKKNATTTLSCTCRPPVGLAFFPNRKPLILLTLAALRRWRLFSCLPCFCSRVVVAFSKAESGEAAQEVLAQKGSAEAPNEEKLRQEQRVDPWFDDQTCFQ